MGNTSRRGNDSSRRRLAQVLPESWVLLNRTIDNGNHPVLRVTKAEEVSRADFALNSKVY